MKNFELSNGLLIPCIGLGTSKQSEKGFEAAQIAFREGYRHFDCASVYDNELELGQAFAMSPAFDRKDVFITSKIWNNCWQDPFGAIKKSLEDLQLSYIDLYLIHWPITQDPLTGKMKIASLAEIEKLWMAMETLVEKGLTKSIGVSNFTIERLEALLKVAKIKPVCNQVEMHPYLQQPELLEYCQSKNIVIVAYSPLGSGDRPDPVMKDPKIIEIAQTLKVSVGTLLISWALQRGTCVIPKSSNAQRIKSNLDIIKIPDKEFEMIRKLDKRKRYIDAINFANLDVFEDYKK